MYTREKERVRENLKEKCVHGEASKMQSFRELTISRSNRSSFN